MKIVKMGEVPREPAPSPLHTGDDVTRQILFPESQQYKVYVANWGKNMRNKFHVHDCEQILIITAGKGIVATEEEERSVTVGDVILISAGEKHCHGATEESECSHIYIMKADFKTTQLED
ncbi:cupin domain-containing protein [Chloroflexota bacterium]